MAPSPDEPAKLCYRVEILMNDKWVLYGLYVDGDYEPDPMVWSSKSPAFTQALKDAKNIMTREVTPRAIRIVEERVVFEQECSSESAQCITE